MSDNARYYLEKAVPELEDLQKKKLFNKTEIKAIMRRWTDFEHRVMSRDSRPEDYLRYIKYEKNLERLRKLRVKRMSAVIDRKRSISDWSGTRRIMFIFDRAVRKHPSNMRLWAEYLKYAKKTESVKVVYKIYSQLLQHRPTNVNIWLSAARYEYEVNTNVKSARNLYKRCLRFNGEDMVAWMEFLKFEMNYLSKLLVRRKLFNLISEKQQQDDLKENERNSDGLAEGSELVALGSEGSVLSNLPDLDMSTLGNVDDNPVLRGDLILTLYDVCLAALTKRCKDDKEALFDKTWQISSETLKMVDSFEGLNRGYLCSHIVGDLMEKYPADAQVVTLNLELPLRYTKLDNEDFVAALQSSVKMYQSWSARTKADEDAKAAVKREFLGYLRTEYLQKAEGETKDLLEMLVKRITA